MISIPPARADWPEFRGPYGNGHVAAPGDDKPVGLPLTWSETENVRWKTPIPHRGWSTPVVMDGQIWLTTATEDGHDYFAICVDADTGKVLHNKKLFHSDEPEPLGNKLNCYAAPSPAIEPGRVYVHFGSYGTACLDTATGEVALAARRPALPPLPRPVVVRRAVREPGDPHARRRRPAVRRRPRQENRRHRLEDRSRRRVERPECSRARRRSGRSPAHPRRRPSQGPQHAAHRHRRRRPRANASAAARRPRSPTTRAPARRSGAIDYDDFSVAPRPLYQDGIAYIVTGITHPELWAIRVGGTGDLTESDNVLLAAEDRASPKPRRRFWSTV